MPNQTCAQRDDGPEDRDLSFIWTDGPVTVLLGDVRARLAELESESVQCVVTSPPYWGLRDYNIKGQLGRESSPDEYVATMAAVFEDVRRVLRTDGTCWVNMGDCWNSGTSAQRRPSANHGGRGYGKHGYWTNPNITQRAYAADLKAKDLVGVPWMLAFALRAAGWFLRSDIIWSKPNPMPESVTDRPTKAHEYLFLLTRSGRYYYDADAIRTPLQPKTFTTFGTTRNDPGDGSGLVKSENFGRDVPTRRPRLKQDVIASAAPAGGDRFTGFNGRYKNAMQDKQNGHRRLVENVKAAREAGGAHDQPFDLAGANKRSVWEIATNPYPEAHFATFPEALVEPCIKAGSREGDVVLDPFAGSGTTLAVARRLGRRAIGIELQPDYLPLIQRRVREAALPLVEVMDGAAAPSSTAFNEV